MTASKNMMSKLNEFLDDMEKITSTINEKDLQNLKSEGAQQYKKLLTTIKSFKTDAKDFANDSGFNEGTIRRVVGGVADKFEALKNNKPIHEFYDESQDFFSSLKKSCMAHPLQAGIMGLLLLILLGKK